MPSAAAEISESSGYVASGDGSIYCFVSAPRAASRRRLGRAAVLLGPFAEEKKSSLRALVETARSLASAGITALRVDFRGTGDAAGLSEDVSVESMIEDALSAVGFARSECGAKRTALLGVRLGGAVAALAAGRARPDAMVLIQPVVSGQAYARELSRHQAIRRMLTSGKGGGPSGGETGEGPLDVDGLALSRRFVAELGEVDITRKAVELGSGSSPAVLLLQLGPRAEPSRELVVLAEALGNSARAEAIVARPFWLQTDYVDPAPATARAVEFLRSALGGDRGTVTAGGEEAEGGRQAG